MQISSRVQTQSNTGGVKAQQSSQNANPFALSGNQSANGSNSNLNMDQQGQQKKNTRTNNAANQDALKDERVKQLQTLINQEQQQLAKLQEAMQEQLQGASGGQSAQQADKMKTFQFALGAKASQLGRLQQALSQEMGSGTIGGFVGQQAGGSGIRLSVQA